jgi:hypothetical protein
MIVLVRTKRLLAQDNGSEKFKKETIMKKIVNNLWIPFLTLFCVFMMLGTANSFDVGLPTLEVPFFSQNDMRWAEDQLGDCTGWHIGWIDGQSSYPPKRAAGCATTSKAMVFNYYHPDYTDPGSLNICLTQNGGYAGGCLAPWDDRNNICAPPGVFFAGHIEENREIIDSELLAGRPVIAQVKSKKVRSHFVVITGINESTYDINDPWDSEFIPRTLDNGALGSYKIKALWLYHNVTGGGFFEDFNDGLADNWIDDGTGRWSVGSGVYKMDSVSLVGAQATSYYNTPYEDFELEGKVNKISGSSDEWYNGLMFKLNGAQRYLFVITPSGYYSLWKNLPDGSGEFLIEWTTSSYINKGFGSWNTLKIKMEESLITLYINGNYVDDYDDASYITTGYVGLMSFDADGREIDNYDDVSLNDLSSANSLDLHKDDVKSPTFQIPEAPSPKLWGQ